MLKMRKYREKMGLQKKLEMKERNKLQQRRCRMKKKSNVHCGCVVGFCNSV